MPYRRILVTVAALSLGVSACGSSHKTSASVATSVTTAVPPTAKPEPPPSTTTIPAPAPNPVTSEKVACLAFSYLDIFVTNAGEQAPEAQGQIGGMVSDAEQAVAAGPNDPAPAKLLTDLKALQAFAQSAQWTPTTAMASTPAMVAVQADCKPFLPK